MCMRTSLHWHQELLKLLTDLKPGRVSRIAFASDCGPEHGSQGATSLHVPSRWTWPGVTTRSTSLFPGKEHAVPRFVLRGPDRSVMNEGPLVGVA